MNHYTPDYLLNMICNWVDIGFRQQDGFLTMSASRDDIWRVRVSVRVPQYSTFAPNSRRGEETGEAIMLMGDILSRLYPRWMFSMFWKMNVRGLTAEQAKSIPMEKLEAVR